MADDALDPKGLIRESFRIDGIGMAECRSIFVDWALSVPSERTDRDSLQALVDLYEGSHPGHPMIAVLREGLAGPAGPPARRGRRRVRGADH